MTIMMLPLPASSVMTCSTGPPTQFEQWEDAYWSQRAAEVLARHEPTVPWEQGVAELEAGDAGTGARGR
ncbi:MAG: hypothetical protein ACRDQ4_01805 [Pseudonocardiaceae bacterium]